MSPSTDDHIIEKTEAWGVKGVNDKSTYLKMK